MYGNTEPGNVDGGHQYRVAADCDGDQAKVHVVNPATSASVDTTLFVTHVIADDNKFLTAAADEGNASLVFSYDDGREVTMEKFEELIDDDNNAKTVANTNGSGTDDDVTVVVLVYNADGASVFTIILAGSAPSN